MEISSLTSRRPWKVTPSVTQPGSLKTTEDFSSCLHLMTIQKKPSISLFYKREIMIRIWWKVILCYNYKKCRLSALLYKCEAQRSSCGQCLKAPPAFECGWCTETRKCLLRQHCPSPEQNWMHHGRHNLRCSHPRIAKVGSQTCNLAINQGIRRPRLLTWSTTVPYHANRLRCHDNRAQFVLSC